jgi:hypothetical protein
VHEPTAPTMYESAAHNIRGDEPNTSTLHKVELSRGLVYYAVLVGGANGDGAQRGLVTIVELRITRPSPIQFQPPGSRKLIYTVIYMSGCPLSQANPNPRLTPPPELRGKALLQELRQEWQAEADEEELE